MCNYLEGFSGGKQQQGFVGNSIWNYYHFTMYCFHDPGQGI